MNLNRPLLLLDTASYAQRAILSWTGFCKLEKTHLAPRSPTPSGFGGMDALFPIIADHWNALKQQTDTTPKVLVHAGPGSFAGIRAGFATAQGLARASLSNNTANPAVGANGFWLLRQALQGGGGALPKQLLLRIDTERWAIAGGG